MTAAIDIVRSLHSRGIEMAIEGESIRVRGRGEPLTDAEREALLQCKGEVIDLLRSREANQSDPTQNLTKPDIAEAKDPKNTLRSETSPYGQSIGGRPLTYTGKVVSLDAWRELLDWEKHGPNERHWSGVTGRWEEPEH